jgi:hypothetical protein
MAKPAYRRKKKLIKPKFQIKVAAACLGLALMAVITLMIMINEAILDFADQGWVDSAALQHRWIGILLGKLAIALAIFAPMTLALGILLMHKVAGPLYRFEMYLGQVARGETTEPCRIRKGDELQDMCDTINHFTAPIRDGTVDRAPFAEAMGCSPLRAPTAEEEAAAASAEASPAPGEVAA